MLVTERLLGIRNSKPSVDLLSGRGGQGRAPDAALLRLDYERVIAAATTTFTTSTSTSTTTTTARLGLRQVQRPWQLRFSSSSSSLHLHRSRRWLLLFLVELLLLLGTTGRCYELFSVVSGPVRGRTEYYLRVKAECHGQEQRQPNLVRRRPHLPPCPSGAAWNHKVKLFYQLDLVLSFQMKVEDCQMCCTGINHFINFFVEIWSW